jgi:hypothetical protein
MYPWYTVGRKMSVKNLEQWINIKFWVKIVESASETLTLALMVNNIYYEEIECF